MEGDKTESLVMGSIYVRQSKMHMHTCQQQQQRSYPDLQPTNTGSEPRLLARTLAARKWNHTGFQVHSREENRLL